MYKLHNTLRNTLHNETSITPITPISPIKRLVCMFTIINLGFVLAFPYHPSDIQDIVRATTLLILVVVISVWLSGNITCVYGELYDSFIDNHDSILKKHFLVFLADVVFHVVPFLLLGAPRSPLSVIIAYGLLLVWYSALGDNIGQIYAPSVDGEKALIVGGIYTVAYAFLLHFYK